MKADTIDILRLFNGDVQYVVPRWQRRYCWRNIEIEELVDDLLAVAKNSDAARPHYGGATLTFPEPGGPAGIVRRIRVVDGQQRLTTVSILLSCIAEKLGQDGHCGEWTAEEIRTRILFNLVKGQRRPKLRLQNGDDQEYKRILDRAPGGPGAVTQAWRIISALVAEHDECSLMEGLRRLQVVSIGLDHHDDPQQIFESLNAKGRELTESEKVKNWLLVGLEDSEQRELHDKYWCPIEKSLNVQHGSTKPVDEFLRDLLRWWTGELVGENKSFGGLRRWAALNQKTDRPALLREISELANLYGLLIDTGKGHPDARVDRELCHLRTLGIDIHRPLSLRLLYDSGGFDAGPEAADALAKSLRGISAWLTRLWLTGRIPAGMNKEMLTLARGKGPGQNGNSAEYWLEQINRRRNTQWAVPNDAEVRNGIRTRSAYGGSATKSASAVLYAMMKDKQAEESPPRDFLTLEHVLPQRLTDEWETALGTNAHEIHSRWKNCLPNLVLMGDVKNARVGQQAFQKKRAAYADSAIGLTRQVAEYTSWGESELSERAYLLAEEALRIWPWEKSGQATRKSSSEFAALHSWRWRIGDGEWHNERNQNEIVLNVARALLESAPENLNLLTDESPRLGVVHISKKPIDTSRGPWRDAKPVPGFTSYFLNPWAGRTLQDYRRRCEVLAERCNVNVEVEVHPANSFGRFWRYFRERDGVPGIPDEYVNPLLWTSTLNPEGDCVVIRLDPEQKQLSLHIGVMLWGKRSIPRDGRSARVSLYSSEVQQNMSDQVQCEDTNPKYSVGVRSEWESEDDAGWEDATTWISDQYKRLEEIVRRNSD